MERVRVGASCFLRLVGMFFFISVLVFDMSHWPLHIAPHIRSLPILGETVSLTGPFPPPHPGPPTIPTLYLRWIGGFWVHFLFPAALLVAVLSAVGPTRDAELPVTRGELVEYRRAA